MPVSPSPARLRRRRSGWRRMAAWVAACATHAKVSRALVAGFIVLHVALWSRILTVLKQGQDIHFDIAEAYAWGQQFLLGYGKHPPLSGWVAGVWFRLFPVTDGSAYALAIAVIGFSLWVCWLIALKVVDRRRAFFVVVMLAIYPIFNFKGFKFNADLIQLATMPLLVLAYLHAFDKRTALSGLWLGLAGALALLAKYWALTMIGAIGIAALLHPQRLAFLRSPAPWVAIAAMLAALTPHLAWLWRNDFEPLTYAGGAYEISSRLESLRLAGNYLGHSVAMLLPPVAIGALALIFPPWRSLALVRNFPKMARLNWSRAPNPAVRIPRAIQIWIIQGVIAIGPPLGGVAFAVYMKTDWGIPLFFLVPLSLLAIPMLRVPRIALFRIVAIWLLASLGALAAAPEIASRLAPRVTIDAGGNEAIDGRSDLARDLTQQWRLRYNTPWPAVVGSTRVANLMAFYSPDHPTPLAPEEPPSGLIAAADARRSGFIGICEAGGPFHRQCDAWMKANAADAMRTIISTRRFFNGKPGPAVSWEIHFVPPEAARAAPRPPQR
ncbi:MAG: glycosyltransferase family 39 protein [Xanthobacteraceae bacterium]|nr:glycosyltransferase family 39 protein [Xanthobacteraceae bacterium]